MPSPTPFWYRDLGYIGLPPIGTPPNRDGTSRLVTTYFLYPSPPARGAAYVFADGRIIWIEYVGTPINSTGYLQQWLSETGLGLIGDLATRPSGDSPGRLYVPNLGANLPPTAWRDATIRPYVPPGYGVCMDTQGPSGDREVPLVDMLAALPPDAAALLEGAPAAPTGLSDEEFRCPSLSVADARTLDKVLQEAGIPHDDALSGFFLNYFVDLDGGGPETLRVNLWFEPLLPDGSVGCSGCG